MKKTSKFAAKGLLGAGDKNSSLSSGTPKKHILASSEAILLSEPAGAGKSAVSFKEYRELHMAKRQLLYKTPKIIKCKSGEWYVQYYYRHPGTMKWTEHRERKGLNYIKDPEEKQVEADFLRQLVEKWLKEGHGPYDEDAPVEEQNRKELAKIHKLKQEKLQWTIADAIHEFRNHIKEQGYAESTITAYKKYINAFETWSTEKKYLNSVAAEFTEIKTEAFLNDYFRLKKWSTRTYNNYMEFMSSFFAQVQKLERKKTENRKLTYDFIASDLKSKITTPQRNKAFTPVMLKELKKQLIDSEESDLKDYLEWIFLSFMRPAEIRALRVADIDEASRQIRINGKTGDRIIPISDQLLRLINRREALSQSIKSYVFGYAGKVDERRMGVEYFLIKFALLRPKLGLDENFGPYSMKPTGVIAMINAGFTDEEIREVTGHKTVEAFRAYKRDLVIENSHVMKGSTIEF